jgi:hypothetical protein
MPSNFLFLFPVPKLAGRESHLLAAWSGLSLVEFYPIAFGLFLARLDLFQISEPADDMFRIDIFEALFNEAAYVSLKRMISL